MSMSVESVGKNNSETNELPKSFQENIEKQEISKEEFLNWADNEEGRFKQESREELSKINSCNLDQSTFEKIKNEADVENDLNKLNEELEETIAQAKASSEIWESQKNVKEKALQDAIDQEPDYEKKVILKEVGVPALAEPFSDDAIEYFRQDPSRLIKQLDLEIDSVTNDSIREMFSYAKGLHVNELVSKEQKIEIKNKVKDKVLDLYEHRLPGFKEKYLSITNSISERIQRNKNAEEEINELYKPYLVSDDKIRQEVFDVKAKNSGLSEQEMSQLFWQKRNEYNNKIPNFDSEEKSIQEKYHISESDDNFIIQRQKIKDEEELLLKNEIGKLLNPKSIIIEEKGSSKIENTEIDRVYTETLLLGKKLSEFSEAIQEKYKESVEKYSQGLSSGMEEKDENGLTSVDKVKDTVRKEYDNTMNKLGILSSQAGASDNWIYWDLGKQAYLANHAQESNQNYRLGNPFAEQNQEILTDITNRHVGWEILGYIKNNPDFLGTLNKSKRSYSKIVSLISEEKELGKLPSYKLSELGELIQENRIRQ